MTRGAAAILTAALLPVTAVWAQTNSNETARPDRPATPPAAGSSSGTAPGNAGSTGWSGGTGGSNIGTSPHAPTPGSPTEHPSTATGIDPTKPDAQQKR